MTIKEAIETVSFELGELPGISDEAYEALDFLEEHSDVVEPVRCRDCFYCKQELENPARCVHPAFTWAPKVCLDDYCSRGELWGVKTDA